MAEILIKHQPVSRFLSFFVAMMFFSNKGFFTIKNIPDWCSG